MVWLGGDGTADDRKSPLPIRSESALDATLTKVLAGTPTTDDETAAFATAVLQFLAGEYSRRGWVFQLHIGTLRNNNTRMYEALGADTGFDSMADGPMAAPVAALLDRADRGEQERFLFAATSNRAWLKICATAPKRIRIGW